MTKTRPSNWLRARFAAAREATAPMRQRHAVINQARGYFRQASERMYWAHQICVAGCDPSSMFEEAQRLTDEFVRFTDQSGLSSDPITLDCQSWQTGWIARGFVGARAFLFGGRN